MALVLPLLLMIVFGVVEFGATYSNFINLRDGVRNAARSASVGNFGTTTSCNLTGASEASTNVQRLMCLTKQEAGLDTTQLRVKVLSADSTFATSGTFAKNDGIIICAQIPTKAMTGFLSTALTGKTLQTKVAMRIERSGHHRDGGRRNRTHRQGLVMVYQQRIQPVNRLRSFLGARRRDDEGGFVIIIVAIAMVMLLAFLALVVDIGNGKQIKRQAQATADASSLAAVEQIATVGADFTGSSTQWAAVVQQVKLYAYNNYGMTSQSWVNCQDVDHLDWTPDAAANNNTCISADLVSWPNPQPGETTWVNTIRVKTPTKIIKTVFGGSIGSRTSAPRRWLPRPSPASAASSRRPWRARHPADRARSACSAPASRWTARTVTSA
jgi:Flp pilus assembly protein TadG